MKLHRLFVFVLILLFISSCGKYDKDASGLGDAIIIIKQSGTDTVYAYSLYAYTFSSFQSVVATNSLEEGKIYTLNMNHDYQTNFYYEPSDAEFTTKKPVASTFNFSAVFGNGLTGEFQDDLTDKVLAVPTIEGSVYNATTAVLTTTWAPVTDADNYAISIFKGPELVFESAVLASTLRTYAISSATTAWITDFTPAAGDSFTVRLNAYLYETSGDSYHMQAVSFAEEKIVWGN